jgi:hypothetical protein
MDITMAIDLEAILGKDNMVYDSKDRVIAIIRALPGTVTNRRFIYSRWLRQMGKTPLTFDLDVVGEPE